MRGSEETMEMSLEGRGQGTEGRLERQEGGALIEGKER